jgi:uncharacterized membrane protein YsdA (DUF1294 family)
MSMILRRERARHFEYLFLPDGVRMYSVATDKTFKFVGIQKLAAKIDDFRARSESVFKNFVVEHLLMTMNGVYIAMEIFKHSVTVNHFTDNVIEISFGTYRHYRAYYCLYTRATQFRKKISVHT